MTYFICAFIGEARSFIEKRALKRSHDLPYPLFQNKDTMLVITGMGYQNALKVTTALMRHRQPTSGDRLINIGVCAAPRHYPVGSMLVVKEIRYKQQSVFLDNSFEHNYTKIALQSMDTVQEYPCDIPVDMEAFGVYSAALPFMQPHRMLFIKIVSDHFEPDSISVKEMIRLIALKTDNIEALLLH